jgi:hypothetical protein
MYRIAEAAPRPKTSPAKTDSPAAIGSVSTLPAANGKNRRAEDAECRGTLARGGNAARCAAIPRRGTMGSMLFRMDDLRVVADGRITLAVRRWRKPTVRTGGTLQTALGLLDITTVEPTTLEALTASDAWREYHREALIVGRQRLPIARTGVDSAVVEMRDVHRSGLRSRARRAWLVRV